MSIIGPLLSLFLDFAISLLGHLRLPKFYSSTRNPEILGFFSLEAVKIQKIHGVTSVTPLGIRNFSVRSPESAALQPEILKF